MSFRVLAILAAAALLIVRDAPPATAETAFPDSAWTRGEPEEYGADPHALDTLAERLGGRGCVIKNGVVIHQWGDQTHVGDWYSSAKPVLSTLLFFAVEDGLVRNVDQPVAEFGWELHPRHQGITFRQLGAMTSGYARPEAAGEAWAYNDFAIQLYQKTLFDKVFHAHGNEVVGATHHLGPLAFEDGLRFTDKHRMKASVRDFARVVWFWCQHGKWQGRQLLPRRYFDDYMRPQTPKDIPHTEHNGIDDDYLEIGSYGGSSDHFSDAGPGIYGFNWWFNDTGRLHPDTLTWPDAPADTVMAIGARGNCAAFIPSLNAALICADGNWGSMDGGNRHAKLNQVLKNFALACGGHADSAHVRAPATQWQPVSLDFAGPHAAASDNGPNPFLDFRLQVRFTAPSGVEYDVPGYFAGDGTGGLAGEVWRVRFAPDESGTWRFRVSFRKGAGIAVHLDADAGEPTAFDGAEGTLAVDPHSKDAPGFYRWGRLEYVGGHYLKFRDGPYWLKGGTDSPENFLAYHGFANAPRGRHTYETHIKDWRLGDPDWGDGAGRGIIGALNYLAGAGVNSIYFLTMNIGGDGKDVFPYLGAIDPRGHPDNDNLHFDLTKLHQWSLVFDHAQRLGIMLHFVLNEAEEPNKRELDDGALGVERKLYYRELVARFGHYPALQWNLCEEYNIKFDFGPDAVKSFAQYIRDIDPHDRPITVHHAGRVDKAWAPFLGDARFPVASFQVNDIGVVETWRDRSRAAGLPLVIGMDEFFPDKTREDNVDRHRKEYLWPIYFSGGQVEFILDELLATDDFRRYARLWKYMAIAHAFMEDLPFWEMEPSDHLVTGAAAFHGENNTFSAQVFAKEGVCYAVYYPVADQTGTLDLTNAGGEYTLTWFNPRTGTIEGAPVTVRGGTPVVPGAPPAEPGEDWTLLLLRR